MFPSLKYAIENEDEALDNAQMEMSFDNLEEIEVLGTVNEEDE